MNSGQNPLASRGRRPDKARICASRRHRGQGLTPGRKWLLGGAAAVAIVMPLALGMTAASKAATQSAEASNGRLPSLKAVSIKLNDAPRAVEGFTFYKGRFVATESTMHMIAYAYGDKHPLKPAQVLGGPDWMKTNVFNIEGELSKSLSDQAKPPLRYLGPPPLYPAGVRRTDAIKHVFRSLLTNHFKLRIKHETKVLPVYELALAQNGPKITEDKTTGQPCRITGIGPEKGLGMGVKSCDFRTFTGFLSIVPELRSRVLVDKTGLQGRYSFKLHWKPHIYVPPGRGTPAAPSGPSLFTALRQVGLKVVSAKAPVDVIVIEHIERPTPN